MKLLTTFLACLLALPILAEDRFHWNWRKAAELSCKDPLQTSPLPKSEQAAIAGVLRKLLKDHPESAWATRIKLVDLNGDGSKEVVAQACSDNYCSPTGNCPLWVLERSVRGYRVILKSFGQTFTIQGRTNGYSDIVVSMHGSATVSGLRVFRYRDGSYQKTGCYDASWEIMTDEGYRTLKEPQVTPCK